MSFMKTVVLTTLASEEPAFSSTLLRFAMDCLVWSSMVDASTALVAGLIGICPEQKMKPPAFNAWLYGPSAFGAFSVAIVSIISSLPF